MSHSQRLTESLLANGPFVRSDAPYSLLCVAGRDAADFLQRLCSQDVKSLSGGMTLPAAFLDAKGKVVATCLVQRVQQGGEPACDEWIGAETAIAPERGSAVMFAWKRGGVQFVRRHFTRGDAMPEWSGSPLDADRADCLQMVAGIVSVGVDTESSTLALEAFLDDHCSTTKGCYTGQEIVARIYTYGHTNRALCLLELAAGPRVSSPVVLHECEDDLPVGRVMRAAPMPGGGSRLGLGYLPKDFQREGAPLRLAGGGDVVVVRAFLAG